jgi:hypothetical protein
MSSGSRVGAARRRAAVAKLALAAAGVLAFVASAALARVAYPGHPKKAVKSLAPPGRFVQVVRENQLQAGMLGPARADPSVVSAPT